jgi:2-C-methyl-D-erythritol 4-phosphate cytidylyltransferase/2-C-methyl-D-erythritol 2,4-cyclodiphosphate synthase
MVTPSLPQRIGMGFDVHPFEPARPLFLGGVAIPDAPGLAGHSDADVLLHAIADAIFGGLGAGDIGTHFPNTDPQWRNCQSRVFVETAVAEARAVGYGVANLDCTLLVERPKIAPHVPAMKEAIAAMLGVAPDCVGIKATTMEQLGAIGRGEGIAAMAVVLLQRSDGRS